MHNRSDAGAVLHVLPTLWFRNTWSWGTGEAKPRLARVPAAHPVVRAEHPELGVFYLHAEPQAEPAVLRERDEHGACLRHRPATRFAKDGIGDHLLHGADTINPDEEGTKVAAAVRLSVPAGGQASVLVRLTREGPGDAQRALRRRRRAHRGTAGRRRRVL